MKYIVRIELHEAEPKDYDTLHKEMENRGYARKINNDDLPHATYFKDAIGLMIGVVAKDAIDAAAPTNKERTIVVAEANAIKVISRKY